MEELIKKIVNIISDYRRDDIGYTYNQEINELHIKQWINQFNPDDREFVLSELLFLLPKSYLTKEHTLRILANEFETLRKDYSYNTIQEFLDETIFLDCQEEGKSQKVLLGFINQILIDNYGYTLADCGKKNIKNWIYFDDVLASGATFRNDIIGEIEKFGVEDFKKSNIRIIASFVIIHTWATSNVRFAIEKSLNCKTNEFLKFYRVAEIENNPKINYFNKNPEFNHLFPINSKLGEEVLEFIENSFDREYGMRNADVAFRNPKLPQKEDFFSSPENRIRYESILLEKGFEIMKSIESLNAPSLRPLGMTPPSYKTLGTGTHFFTWRNISNTCPIVFWWGTNDWYALFPVKNRGGH